MAALPCHNMRFTQRGVVYGVHTLCQCQSEQQASTVAVIDV